MSNEKDETTTAEPPRKIRSLPAANLKLAEYTSQTWACTPEPNTPVDRLLESDYWAHHARQFNRTDRIIAISEDNGYFCELIIRDCSKHFCAVSLLRKVDLAPIHSSDSEDLPTGHSVEWMGPEQRWAALRGSQVLRAEFVTKSEACEFILQLGAVGAA